MICSTPSYALNIAEVAVGMGVDIRNLPLSVGIFGAEPWSSALRRDLEDTGSASRRSTSMACRRSSAPGLRVNAAMVREGLHAWEDHFLFEVIDPKTLQPVRTGEPGELVITTLTKEALPMIRYRTRDITRLNYEPCQCGRTHVRIMRITGRDDDMMIIRGVNVYPSQIEAVLVGIEGVAPHYQIVLTRDGALDNVTVEVETAPGGTVGVSHHRETTQNIRAQIKAGLGVNCEVVSYQGARASAALAGQGGARKGFATEDITQGRCVSLQMDRFLSIP